MNKVVSRGANKNGGAAAMLIKMEEEQMIEEEEGATGTVSDYHEGLSEGI